MTVPTVTVSIAVSQITGVALPAGRVRFELTAADIDGGIVATASANVVLDANGTGTAALWPNAAGTQGSQYRVTICDANGALQGSWLATVPNANCNLHDIIDLPAPGTVLSLAAGFVTVAPPAGYTSTNQQAMDQELATAISNIVAGAVAWGTITGTLASQTDLSTALAGKQPLDSDLTAIAALATTSYGRAFLALADAAAGRTALALGTAATAATGDFDAAGAAAAAQAASQPLDSDLTAIAALTTTTFGRAVLALADAAALRTAAGLGTLATQSGTFSGTSSGANTGDQDLSGLVPKTTTVNGHALSANVTVSASDVSLGSVTNDAQTKAAVVPNTAPAAGEILVGNAGGTAFAKQAVSGDAALSSAGAITVTKTNGTAFGALATVTPGTGVATALAVNVGTAGAPVVNGGALGTPSSGTLTNATGLPPAGVVGTAAILGGNTFTGAQVLSDQQVSRAMLIDCGATFLDKGNSGTSTQTLDYTAGSHQKITATGNFTLAVSNLPPTGNLGAILLEAVNFGSQTVTWPTASFVKPDGSYTSSVSTWLAAWTGRTVFQTSGTDWIKIWSRDASTLIIGWAA